MDKQIEKHQSSVFINNMVESSIRIGLLFVLLIWTYDIIKPFIIPPVLWGGDYRGCVNATDYQIGQCIEW